MQLLSEVQVTHRHALPDACRHLQWTDTTLIAGCDDGSIMACDNRGILRSLSSPLHHPVTAIAANAELLAVGALDGSVIIAPRTGEVVSMRLRSAVRGAVAVGDRAVFAAGEELVVSRGSMQDAVPVGIGALTTLTHVEGGLVLVGGVRGVAWFDVALLANDGRIDLPTIVSTSTDPRRRFVAAGDLGGSVHLLQPGSDEGSELTGYPDRVSLLAWMATGVGLCATADDELTVWRAADDGLHEPEPVRLVAHDEAITALAASPTSDLVATGDAEGHLCLWSPLRVETPVAHVSAHGVVLALAWAPSGHELAVSTSAGELLRCAVVRGSIV
jgi:hypothetical protein